MAVPAIALAVNVAQYRNVSYLAIEILSVASAVKIAKKMVIVVPYPRLNVIENISAPVSPSVVEAILMTQYMSMICGTLFTRECFIY